MSYRRDTFRKNAARFMKLELEDSLIINMEKGVFNNSVEYCKNNNLPLKWSNTDFVKNYSKNARRVLANINYTTNAPVLREKIKDGIIQSYNLVKMTKEEMNPEVWTALKTKIMNQAMFKKEEYEDGMFKCNRCKSMKTVYYQMQTRSADEPMTTYVTCTECNLKWKC